MNGTRDWGASADAYPEGQIAAGRKTYAMVSSLSAARSLASELVESSDGHEEVIKVYLKGRAGDKQVHEKNVDQLKSEVQYIQEVVLEAPNGFSPSPPPLYRSPPEEKYTGFIIPSPVWSQLNVTHEDVQSLRKSVQDLLTKLQEAERKHQSDRVAFEVTLSRYQREAEQSHAALRRAEARAEQKEAAAGQLQGRLLALETEHQAVLVKLRDGETALEELRSRSADCQAEQEKAAGLEKEVAGLREKIHHLDDMLKSQQRKVRQMIEQLQNSKAVVQSKDSTIQELKEKIAYLEAENLEMHDRIEHLIEKQVSPGGFSTQTRARTESLGSVRISKPPGPKPLPLIRVVET